MREARRPGCLGAMEAATNTGMTPSILHAALLLLLTSCTPSTQAPVPAVTDAPTHRIYLCDALDVPTLLDPTFPSEAFLTLEGVTFGRARPHRPGGHAFAWSLVDRAHDGTRDWSYPDAAVRTIQDAGADVVGTVENAVDPGADAGVMELYVPPGDLEGFTRFVADLVERYDGDGEADMPGLGAPVAAWELGNEPSCTPDDDACADTFVALMDASAAAARSADETVEIYPAAAAPPLLPGSTQDENPRFAGPWERWLERGDRSNVDGLVVHALVGAAHPGVSDILAWWKDRAPDLPLTVGELGSRGVGGEPRVHPDPEEEADWLRDEIDDAFTAGAVRVGWCHTRHAPEAIPTLIAALADLEAREP